MSKKKKNNEMRRDVVCSLIKKTTKQYVPYLLCVRWVTLHVFGVSAFVVRLL